jgi:hypothetical protein
MPHPDILRVLDMTAQEWGKLPFHDDMRQRLKEKAIAILRGDEVPVNASTKAVAIHEATLAAEASGNISRAGFEQAMIQQAKMFGEAVQELRALWQESKETCKALAEEIQTIKDFHSSIVDQIRVMEDSRADYTHVIEERCKTLTETVQEFGVRLNAITNAPGS